MRILKTIWISYWRQYLTSPMQKYKCHWWVYLLSIFGILVRPGTDLEQDFYDMTYIFWYIFLLFISLLLIYYFYVIYYFYFYLLFFIYVCMYIYYFIICFVLCFWSIGLFIQCGHGIFCKVTIYVTSIISKALLLYSNQYQLFPLQIWCFDNKVRYDGLTWQQVKPVVF